MDKNKELIWSNHAVSINSVCFMPNKNIVVIADNDANVISLDAENGYVEKRDRAWDAVKCVSFSLDGNYLYYVEGSYFKIKNMKDYFLFAKYLIPDIQQLIPQPGNDNILITTLSHLKIYNREKRMIITELKIELGYPIPVCFSPDGKQIAVGNGNIIQFYTVCDLSIINETNTDFKNNITHIRWSPDGKWILINDGNNILQLYNVLTGFMGQKFISTTGMISDIYFVERT